MKITNCPPYFNIILIINFIILFLSSSVIAQNKDIVSQLDTTSFKGKPLLNKSIRISNFFDPFREKQKKINSNKEVELVLSANYFNYLSEILEQADLNDKPLNAKLKGSITKKGKEVSDNTNISIGIINAEALLLTKEQMELNTKAKKNNTKADSKDYETIEFIGAGLLQAEAFQGSLSFEIDPTTIINNIDNPIKSLAIDFDEGKGFEDIGWKQQIILHQFSKTGDLSIKIKLTTKRGIYITTCPFKVHFLLRPIPSYRGTVSSPKIKGGRIAVNVAGAEYEIFLGCDGILDKPIIVAEGFDSGNRNNIINMVANYRENLRVFLDNGYDLVFVNYDNGVDFIENNAQALKRVIQEINSKKIGHGEINKLSIIGLSMSGLIARWGLREMENAGQNHEVSRLICLDTPHKGANSSPGVSYVAADFANRGIASGLIEALLYNIVPELSAIDSPAAQEQLLFQNTSMTSHVYFSLFQNVLANLGNGGYPSQCKNIAFVNGALNGNQNRRPNGDLINAGDKIWDTNFEYAVCYGYIDCWTNVPNQNTEVYNEDAFGIPILCPIQFSTRSINLPYNLDRLAGGFNSNVSNQPGQQTFVFPRFAFVPTFSAVDYKGSLNNDADYTININDWLDGNWQVKADRQHLTPFSSIYGNDNNNQHPFIGNELDGIRNLAANEFGLNPFSSGCIGCITGSGGLKGTYFDNQDLTNNGNTRTNTTEVNFSSDEGLPIPSNGAFSTSNISARWEGSFEAPISGTYNFNVRTDDGVRVWFDNTLVVSDWGNYPPKDHNFQHFFFNAGERKNIKIEWFQGAGGYTAKFLWSFNGVESIVPACRLFTTTVTPPTADCNFTVSASAIPSSVGCGGTSSLSSGCSGSGCSGVSYAWNGNGNNYTDSPVSVTLPNTNGQVSYNLTASKAGCGNSTASTTVTVSGCTGGGGGTTDRTEGGNASDEGASNPGNEGESQAFDNSNFTKWLIFSPTGKITYDFNSEDSYVINQYTVTAANDEPSRDPKNWVLEGSNDGSNWNIVDSRNDQFFNSPRYDTKPYSFNNTTAYKQYRLNVTANHGNGLLQIAEIQMFGPANTGGCTPPSPPSVSSNTTTAPANLTASGCVGSITWSNGSNTNPLNGVGSGTYTATCTVNNCTSGPSNSIAIVGGGGSCPTYPNAPQWFHWDNASSSLWFAHYGSTGLLYAATDANPATPPLSRQQLLNSGVTPTLANCFLDGSKARIAAVQADETDDKVIVSPNPTTGKIKIVFSLQKTENVWLNLYDTQGRYLDLRNYEGKLGLNEIEFDLQNQPTGVYFVNLQSSQRNEIQKVVKVN